MLTKDLRKLLARYQGTTESLIFNRNKVMVMNKTTKKLKPLFPKTSTSSKSKFSQHLNSTLRVYSNEPKVSVQRTTQDKNEELIDKLLKLVTFVVRAFRTVTTRGTETKF